MPVNSSLVRAYTNGAVSTTAYGVTNPTLPTTGSASLDAAFSEIGALSSDGVTESTSQDRTDIFIWQGNALVRKIPGEYTKQWKLAAAETSLITLGINYPGSTITQTSEGVSIVERPPSSDVRAWVLHGVDGTKAQRIVVPFGEITERGDVVWSAEDITVYEWTLSAYVNAGVIAYRYYVDSLLSL